MMNSDPAQFLFLSFFSPTMLCSLWDSGKNTQKNYTKRIFMTQMITMASSTLAWKIPWMEEPGGLQSMGSQRVGHD